MPNICKLVRLSSRTLSRCHKKKKPAAAKKSYSRMKRAVKSKSFDDHLSDWVAKKKELGVPESKLFLPFLVGAPKLKLAECRECENIIYPEDIVSCSMKKCKVSYHSRCASDRFGVIRSSKDVKCPQHECFHCKKKLSLRRCSRCDLATHDRCAAYHEYLIRSDERSGEMICWRHSATNSPSLKPNNLEQPLYAQPSVPISSIEDVFRFLLLSCVEEEFKVDLTRKHTMMKNLEPPSYVHIKRNIYRIKNKGYDVDHSIGCTGCGSHVCYEDCICRSQFISCTSACKCSENCTNRPFQEEKKVKVVMTQCCGWGVEAVEYIDKGDFIMEYVGEVINDALCEKRFWDMKGQGITKFYVVAVRKDFNIDAKFKGNESRFINHSCDPNCPMEKWDVNWETRLGIFAAKSIKPGEELTFDYGYEMYEHDEVECRCGASNCLGYLGTKNTRQDVIISCTVKVLKGASQSIEKPCAGGGLSYVIRLDGSATLHISIG
ncbi:hypothetical protein L1987_14344 [Smallanthus sonchifolius]|uniref:Uncharacterized protein n=1 Tax=Smallanthus sonchifolius TaxID=185202 RepID=A0ACB9J545_9ASTR|nr:hypothetical protein L1987_14344 [Smallanthus sonchifolius]